MTLLELVAHRGGQHPMITGEIGETDGASSYISPYMTWADAHGVSYLAWTWNLWGCGGSIALITGFNGTACTGYGAGYRTHLASLAVGSPATAPGAPTGVLARPGTATLATTGPIVVTFNAPANHGAAITKYTATCTSSNGGTTRTVVYNGAAAVPMTVGSASLQKSYTCTVRATNAKGTSPASAPSPAIVVGAPAQVGKPAVARTASATISVRFVPLTATQANGSPLSTPNYTAACTSANGGVTRERDGFRESDRCTRTHGGSELHVHRCGAQRARLRAHVGRVGRDRRLTSTLLNTAR